MTTKYCANCGTPHECEAEEAANAEKAAVAIARIEANRDIEVARLQAGAAKAIAITEAEADASRAEGQVEGMETALEAITGTGEPDGDETPPVINVTPTDDPAEDEPAGDLAEAPPIVEVKEPPGPKKQGYWDNYRR